MLLEEPAVFFQFEDSPPPGDSDPHDVVSIDSWLHKLDSGAPVLPPAASSSDPIWKSEVLLDFKPPGIQNVNNEGLAANHPAQPSKTALESSGSLNPLQVSSALEEVLPEKYWEDALDESSTVDLEALKCSAGEVLDQMLMDMMDDVVAGRLNWMRPLPRPRRK